MSLLDLKGRFRAVEGRQMSVSYISVWKQTSIKAYGVLLNSYDFLLIVLVGLDHRFSKLFSKKNK